MNALALPADRPKNTNKNRHRTLPRRQPAFALGVVLLRKKTFFFALPAANRSGRQRQTMMATTRKNSRPLLFPGDTGGAALALGRNFAKAAGMINLFAPRKDRLGVKSGAEMRKGYGKPFSEMA